MATYRDSGVDIGAATHATQLMAAAVRSTYTPAVLAGMGAFGGCFDLGAIHLPTQPVLVSSTDSVGTKTLVAAAVGRYDTVGQDLVNHCVNDILAQGAEPLFFLDYLAVPRLDPQQISDIVAGVAVACRAAGCALIGGETAELPDVYRPEAFDIAGTIVGVVAREQMLPRAVHPGDALLALPSTGLHTNGYSLARRVLAPLGYEARPAILEGASIGESLLAIHRSYLPEVRALWTAGIPLTALAHTTGGGIYDNLPRILPEGHGAVVRRGSWDVPPICRLLVQEGGVDEHEAFHALNMGMGMLMVVPPEAVEQVLQTVPESRLVGEITGTPGVYLI